jgi:hypothetical protein
MLIRLILLIALEVPIELLGIVRRCGRQWLRSSSFCLWTVPRAAWMVTPSCTGICSAWQSEGAGLPVHQRSKKRGSRAICDLVGPAVEHPSAAALHLLKELPEGDPAFAQALGATAFTEAAANRTAEYGVQASPAALWRHRSTLVSGGLPTWRGWGLSRSDRPHPGGSLRLMEASSWLTPLWSPPWPSAHRRPQLVRWRSVNP